VLEKIDLPALEHISVRWFQRLKEMKNHLHFEEKTMESEELQNNPEIQAAKKDFQEGMMCYNRGMSLNAIKYFEKALTVFETYEYETGRLVQDGEWLLAAANVIFSVLAGFAALKTGETIARML